MITKIEELLQEVDQLNAQNTEELEALRIKYLSKKGIINALMADFRNVPAEQKKQVGMKLNELKTRTQERIAALKETFENQDADMSGIDLTRTAYPIGLGTRHPLNIVRNQIIDIFSRLGFTIADGPEVEDDLHVFTKMNFAPDHPARDMQDTFFVETNPDDVTKNIILRTHTSSVQARTMEVTQPPIRVICPGRVYRNEAISYRAHCFFHQVEGLYVDKNVSFTDLKQVLLQFAQEMHLWWRRMSVLQIYRLGGNFGMRHGRPCCARRMRNRQQSLFRLCLRHGRRTHCQPEIQGEGLAHVLGKRHPLP